MVGIRHLVLVLLLALAAAVMLTAGPAGAHENRPGSDEASGQAGGALGCAAQGRG
jgi:hypothetical protein